MDTELIKTIDDINGVIKQSKAVRGMNRTSFKEICSKEIIEQLTEVNEVSGKEVFLTSKLVEIVKKHQAQEKAKDIPNIEL